MVKETRHQCDQLGSCFNIQTTSLGIKLGAWIETDSGENGRDRVCFPGLGVSCYSTPQKKVGS